MPDTNDAIGRYRQAVENLPDVRGDNEDLKVLEALLARDRVASEVGVAENKSPEVLVAIVEADELLKAKAAKVVDLVGTTKLAAWRDARQPATARADQKTEAWWWSLDLQNPDEGWRNRALNYILWGCIVVSLSFIVEGLRRFLSGEVGLLGTVLQGLVTLLVGGTLVEVAKQATSIRSGKIQKQSSRPNRRKLALTFPFIVIAFLMWFLLPLAVKYYSNRGVSERFEGRPSDPIGLFQRTISLDPSDSIAHYNLARAYEAISEYDKAEAEYKSAIRWDDRLSVAYDGLGRLMMLKKDYVEGLRLLVGGLDRLEKQKAANEFENEDHYKRIKVSLLKNRAWAYFGLGDLTQAEDDLQDAIELRTNAAAPRCLLGQVLDERAKTEGVAAKPDPKKIKQAYSDCIALSHDQTEKIEANWLAYAQERVNQEESKESIKTRNQTSAQPRKSQ